MNVSHGTTPNHSRPGLDVAALGIAAFGLVGVAVLLFQAHRTFARAEAAAAPRHEDAASRTPPAPPADGAGPRAAQPGDLEPVVIDVQAEGPAYRVGGRTVTDAAELTRILRPLAAAGGAGAGAGAGLAFVRVNDDASMSSAAGALEACRTAGFGAVSYVPAGPGAD